MELNDYQLAALRTAAPKTQTNVLFSLVLGLTGETGEIAEKFKKLIRDDDSNPDAIDRGALALELGDVLWYVAVLADFFDLKLEDVGQWNVIKLADRQERGVLGGSGDHR